MRGNYNVLPMSFSGNQLALSLANNSERASLKQKLKSLQIMPPVAKNKMFDSNAERENTSVIFNILNYPEESISAYGTTWNYNMKRNNM